MKSFLQSRWVSWIVAASLAVITFAAYFGVWKNNFVELDDQYYVFTNRWVRSGLTWETVSWAFTQYHAQNWHPLTWLSHAMDVQIYGLNPVGHHVTNLIFHLLNTLLVFAVLRQMTGSTWRSALVAALFGVHPLHVESVAWVSERKDVLSGFFFLLTLFAYTLYAHARTPGRQETDKNANSDFEVRSSTFEVQCSPPPPPSHGPIVPSSYGPILWYCLSLLFFALGLMSKPMLVTVPFVLLLLDWWPFGRFDQAERKFTDSLWVFTREKIPFFALSVVSSIITMQAQASAMANMQQAPIGYRFENALRSYWVYIKQTFWPENLTVFYPHAEVTSAQLQSAGLVLAVITLVVLMFAKNFRFLPTGWFWYLGMLVPVIGLVQVGSQAHADRYTYLPHIGFFLAVVWTIGAIAAGRMALRWIFATVMIAVLALLTILSNHQVRVWRDSSSLFSHGARINPKDYLARSVLARHDIEAGRLDEAIQKLEQILREAPKYPLSEFLLAQALQTQGRMEEAIPHLRNIVVETDNFVTSRNARLVLSYLYTGQLAEAQEALGVLVQATPQDPAVWFMQAAILRQMGEFQDAQEVFKTVVSTHGPPPPADNPVLNFEIAELYALGAEQKAAAPYYEKAVGMAPNYTNAFNNYAWLLATSTNAAVRDGAKSVRMAEKACQLSQWKVPVMIGTLAAAYAEAGRFEDAVSTAGKARDLAKAQGMEDVAKRNEELMELYRQQKPYRE